MTERGRLHGALFAAALVASCATADGQPLPTQPTQPLLPLPAPVAAPPTEWRANADQGVRAAVGAALAEAARSTGLPVTALSVLSAERVTWADGSLGCAQPGASYTMALVPGHRVRIHSPEQTLDFHGDMRGNQVLCPAGRATGPIPEKRR